MNARSPRQHRSSDTRTGARESPCGAVSYAITVDSILLTDGGWLSERAGVSEADACSRHQRRSCLLSPIWRVGSTRESITRWHRPTFSYRTRRARVTSTPGARFLLMYKAEKASVAASRQWGSDYESPRVASARLGWYHSEMPFLQPHAVAHDANPLAELPRSRLLHRPRRNSYPRSGLAIRRRR